MLFDVRYDMVKRSVSIVFKFAHRFRKYNSSKKEWMLRTHWDKDARIELSVYGENDLDLRDMDRLVVQVMSGRSNVDSRGYNDFGNLKMEEICTIIASDCARELKRNVEVGLISGDYSVHQYVAFEGNYDRDAEDEKYKKGEKEKQSARFREYINVTGGSDFYIGGVPNNG